MAVLGIRPNRIHQELSFTPAGTLLHLDTRTTPVSGGIRAVCRVAAALLLLWAGAACKSDGGGDPQDGDGAVDASHGDTGGDDGSLSDGSAQPDGQNSDASDADGQLVEDSVSPADIGQPPKDNLPAGFSLEDVRAPGAIYGVDASGETVLAVGAFGSVFRYNGQAWTPEAAPTTEDLYAVWLHPQGSAVAVGAAGTIVVNDGSGWQLADSGVASDLYGVHGRDPQQVVAVGAAGTVVVGDITSGDSWTPEATSWTGPLYSVWVDVQGTAFASTGQSQVLRRTNGAWVSSQASSSGTAIYGLGGVGDEVFAVGSSGALSRWGGSSWVVQISNDTDNRDLHDVWVFPDTTAIAVGDDGAIVKWDGAKWTTVDAQGPLNRLADLRCVAGIWRGADSGPLLFAAGMEGLALVSGGVAGDAWVDTAIGLTADLLDVWVSSDSALAVGEGGVALSLRPGGWSGEETGTTANLTSLWRRGNEWFAAGESGTVLRRSAAGWEDISTPTADDWYGVTATAGAVWVVGEKGRVMRRTSNEWTAESTPFVGIWRDVCPLSNGSLLAVGDNGAVGLRDLDGRWSLLPVSTGATLHRVSVVPATGAGLADMVYIGGDNGTLVAGPADALSVVQTQPLEFIYGVWAISESDVVAVGWGGLHWNVRRLGPGNFEVDATDLGTARVFEAAMGTSADSYFLVGRGGSLIRYEGPTQ